MASTPMGESLQRPNFRHCVGVGRDFQLFGHDVADHDIRREAILRIGYRH